MPVGWIPEKIVWKPAAAVVDGGSAADADCWREGRAWSWRWARYWCERTAGRRKLKRGVRCIMGGGGCD